MTYVWVVQDDEYPMDQLTYGVATSVESAARMVREFYPADYVIDWRDPQPEADDSGDWRMTGVFTAIPGKCGAGPRDWIFTRYEFDKNVFR